MVLRTVGGAATAAFALLIGLNELDVPNAEAWDDDSDPLKIGALVAGVIAFAYGLVEIVDEPASFPARAGSG